MSELRKLLGQYVVVRSSPSGVWTGKLVEYYGNTRVLENARRIWSWSGAASCSGIAVRGPSDGKICEPVRLAVVEECCETLLMEDRAISAIEAIAPWVAS